MNIIVRLSLTLIGFGGFFASESRATKERVVNPLFFYFPYGIHYIQIMETQLQLSYSTPALLFPAVSLLFLAFTNRFITYADLIRTLHKRWQEEKSPVVEGQILNLRKRMTLIRWMQIVGALSLGFATACMFLLFLQFALAAEILFSAALCSMLISLILLIAEIGISMRALDLQLDDMSAGKHN